MACPVSPLRPASESHPLGPPQGKELDLKKTPPNKELHTTTAKKKRQLSIIIISINYFAALIIGLNTRCSIMCYNQYNIYYIYIYIYIYIHGGSHCMIFHIERLLLHYYSLSFCSQLFAFLVLSYYVSFLAKFSIMNAL